jgi:CRISPR-associated endonuclease/helicase Cas3
MAGLEFGPAFRALTDHQPLHWQQRLFELLQAGRVPSLCDLPTGLGKTSVIPIWIIALASQIQQGSAALPRRLVYIVNRRTVVDQATSVVDAIRQRLICASDPRWSIHKDPLDSIGEALHRLAVTDGLLLAVSTLRGEMADNEEWKSDPSRAAIIVGTIDMIGSKLLFNGYGDGPYWRPQHAGLIGQDSLIVHDEAHLTPAFSEVLAHIVRTQHECGEPRPLRVMELSATARNIRKPADVFSLEPQDIDDETVRLRLGAKKEMHLRQVSESGLIESLVASAISHDSERAKVLIYVRSPLDVQKIKRDLVKRLGEGRTALLTGTVRGYERNRLVESDPVYRAFLKSELVPQSVYLVSTSAGEVGVDLDADHMVCDATTLDAMIQRLGRVNRQGGDGRRARIDVLAAVPDEKRKPPKGSADRNKGSSGPGLAATIAILARWVNQSQEGFMDASPAHVRELLDGLEPAELEAAFAPKPDILPLSDIALDAWSMTSIKMALPGWSGVAEYLHGLTHDPPETYLAWRKEVVPLRAAGSDEESLEEWFHACPVLSHERLRDLTTRIRDQLADMLHRRQKNDAGKDYPVVVLNERGEAEWRTLSNVAEKGSEIEYRTIVLPTEVGGLDRDGALDCEDETETRDVAEESVSVSRQRWISVKNDVDELYRRLTTGEVAESPPADFGERHRAVLEEASEGQTEQTSRNLVLWVGPSELAVENPETAKFRQFLSVHSSFIVEQANRIATALGMNGSLKDALVVAALWHDRGKNREVWQRFACNPNGIEPLAKSKKYLHGRALGGYRHEFGSLLDAAADPEITAHHESDLILHLIAAHHGWARPHFEPKAQDPKYTSKDNENGAADVMRRFGHLQQRFGRWGLAWLESLLRCADIAASKQRGQASESDKSERPRS